MAIVISVINQKGGVGKSTTAHALASGLALKNKKVLLIDLDGQCNLTYSTGAKRGEKTSMEVLIGNIEAKEAVQHIENFDMIPASISLASADVQIVQMGKEYKLKEALEPVQADYDVILLDTPPTLGIITVNALTASHKVIVPCQADVFSLEAVGQLYNTILAVKKYTNEDLEVSGILITRYNKQSILSKDMRTVLEKTANQLGSIVFDSSIREGIAIKEAQARKQSIFAYAANSNVAKDYMEFAEEFCSKCNV